MTKRSLPAAVLGARPTGAHAEMAPPSAYARWNPDLQARAKTDTDAAFQIDVLEVIGEDPWTGGGVTARKVSALLRSAGERSITVNINSPGGDFFEGLAIYNTLREHPAEVTVRVLGLAASSASIIAMAGDDIQIGRAGFLMVHNTWLLAAGDRHTLREIAAEMDGFDGVLADIYAARTGQAVRDVTAMLDRETWVAGKDAVDRGFADGFLPSDDIAILPQAGSDRKSVKALHRMEAGLARGGMPRAERRALIKDMVSGMPSAADTGTPSAAVADAFAELMATVRSTKFVS